MNLTLKRIIKNEFGIFSELYDENNNKIAVTLEHSYINPDNTYSPKIYDGTFVCQRGTHQLHSMIQPFETFEVSGVNGHTNILFHVGNYNKDSDGCILLGKTIIKTPDIEMINNSKDTFNMFIALQKGLNQFNLTVSS